MSEGFDDLAKKLRKNALASVAEQINKNLPQGLNFAVPNPDEEHEAEEHEPEQADDDDDGDDEGDDDGLGSLVWEDADPEHNLECAVGAWRAAGDPHRVVGRHKSGAAFFGRLDDLDEYCVTHDLQDDDWEVCDDPAEIMSMSYDLDAMKQVIKLLDTTEYESAKDAYEKFHWGDPSNVTVVKNVTGITAALVHLGVGRRIEYGAKKDGEFAEYYHEFGEDSGKFPQVYAVMDETEKFPVALLIHGGEMRIEPRGIVE